MTIWTRRELLKMGVVAPAAISALTQNTDSANLAAPHSPAAPASQSAPQSASASSVASPRERLLFDFGWRFHLGDADNPSADFDYGERSEFAKSGYLFAPSRPKFDDSQWRLINLPHDFAVELPIQDNVRGLSNHGSRPVGRDYPKTSIGWYRRVFDVPASDLGRRIAIEFDGVFRDSVVAINGFYLGRNMSGYAPFRYDVTDFLNYGGSNVVVVRVNATEYEGWFYEGAGIYRHVWLVKTNPVHVAHWSTYVTTDVRPGAATINISTELENETDAVSVARVTSTIFDDSGKQVGLIHSAPSAVPPRGKRAFKHPIELQNPALWSIETPHMYRLVTTVGSQEGELLDRHETPFGIRTIRFDKDKGFFLNGEPVKVQGTCNHQDHSGVGSALPDRIQYFRIAKLKECGCNAYRTSHNPPTPELLDACDRLGMLVMDETRMMSSDPEGLSQLERMILRDRNHPCVFLWSLGNEEPIQGTDRGERITAAMKRMAESLDATRPFTAAMNGGWGKGVSNTCDVQGFNYLHNGDVDGFHRSFPNKPCIGSEEASAYSTRGIYENDKDKGWLSAYDTNKPDYGTTAEEWVNYYAARDFVAGAFVWTGFDYRGEPSPYGWPTVNSQFGFIDACGFPKDTFYYYKSWWTKEPVVRLFPHWNWAGKEGQEIDVWVHTNCEEVELFLNGKTLGKKSVPRLSHAEWKVKYEAGEISAVGFRDGKIAARDKRETTRPPASILLVPDRATLNADGEDVALVSVGVVDAGGRVVPIADNLISFEVSGPGANIGVGNGNPSNHDPDKAEQCKVFNGLAQIIIQSDRTPGDILVTASSQGLASASLKIPSRAVPLRPSVPEISAQRPA
ncbi:MAG TPA: beta-galactosidase GalA [Candidatus Acidoferrales bacterium]|nr:beta-galactosidase GalA [Candidatus Acidoferrales bacterium]